MSNPSYEAETTGSTCKSVGTLAEKRKGGSTDLRFESEVNLLSELTDEEEVSSQTGDELVDGTDSDESTASNVDHQNGQEVKAEKEVWAKPKNVVLLVPDKIDYIDSLKADRVEVRDRFSISKLNAQIAEEKMQSHKSVPIYTRRFCTQNVPTHVESIPISDEYSIPFFLLLLLLYVCTVILSWYSSMFAVSDQINPVLQSPWIGQHNATKLIGQRLQMIQNRYEEVIVRDDWKLLRMSPNVTIETMNADDGSWPLYIRTSAIFDAQPAEILKHLGWLQFDETQRKVDTFHESAELIFAPSHRSKVVRKTTKRPLVFPKRQMTVALCEKTSKQAFTLRNLKLRTAPMKTFTTITVPKGTLMNAMVNVNIDLDALVAPEKGFSLSKIFHQLSPGGKELSNEKSRERQRQKDRKERHIKAYQDMIGWFIPLESGGTLMVFVMQVDLGPDIPHWAFLTAVAATAIWGMDALNRLCNEK